MARKTEKITVTHDGLHDCEVMRHPSFGQISVSRVAGHRHLYGSESLLEIAGRPRDGGTHATPHELQGQGQRPPQIPTFSQAHEISNGGH